MPTHAIAYFCNAFYANFNYNFNYNFNFNFNFNYNFTPDLDRRNVENLFITC